MHSSISGDGMSSVTEKNICNPKQKGFHNETKTSRKPSIDGRVVRFQKRKPQTDFFFRNRNGPNYHLIRENVVLNPTMKKV